MILSSFEKIVFFGLDPLLSGLYLVEAINMEKSFKPSQQLKKYIKYARMEESNLLKIQEDAMSTITWL
jgi:hypothetical protein